MQASTAFTLHPVSRAKSFLSLYASTVVERKYQRNSRVGSAVNLIRKNESMSQKSLGNPVLKHKYSANLERVNLIQIK